MADIPETTLDQFLSLAAHDMKQPLNVLQMYSGILQRRAKLSSEDELTQVVRGSMKKMQAMVSLLTQWARADRGELKMELDTLLCPQWFTLLDELQSPLGAPLQITHLPQQPTTEQPLQLDAHLLQQSLQDIIYLLPETTPVTLQVEGWCLQIHCATLFTGSGSSEQHQDALYQLAVTAGRAIFGAVGLKLSLSASTQEGHSTLKLVPL